MNRFPFPLYHGTSSLFLSSIEEHGLNGFDPLQQLDLIPVLRHQKQLLDSSQAQRWIGTTLPYTTSKMIDQHGSLWSHGRTYLSISKVTASNYAKRNLLGSELLTRCYELQSLIVEIGLHDNLIDEMFDDRGLNQVFQRHHEPLLISVLDIESEDVEPVDGRPLNAVVEFICRSKLQPDSVKAALLEQVNFTVRKGRSLRNVVVEKLQR